ncbi:MAG: SCO family protein [Sandaracinus sp.]|nr:SCO family protein [Sandaracinus sp.]MCB9619839.1 SCO family protein [Sandaracinus sp.]MCB9622850.1 SCO family protein [Sandaracinus sp.]
MRSKGAWKVALVLALASCGDTNETREHTSAEHAEHAATEHAEHAATEHAEHAAAEHAEHAQHNPAEHAHHEPLPALEAPDPSASLHDLPDVFHDADGHPTTFRDFHGHPTLVAMFYGSCTTVCPLILSDLARIDEGVSSDRLRLAVATFDPERDTPERLRALREERGMDPARWKLLRGDEETTRNLAMAIGVQYRKLSDGEYAHSALLVLLDGEGRLVARHEGLGRPLDGLIAQARALAGATP